MCLLPYWHLRPRVGMCRRRQSPLARRACPGWPVSLAKCQAAPRQTLGSRYVLSLASGLGLIGVGVLWGLMQVENISASTQPKNGGCHRP